MEELIGKLEKFAKSTIDKGARLTDIARLNIDIESELAIIKAHKLVIGEYVAKHKLLSEDELVAEQIDKILKAQSKIAELKERIDLLKKEL